MKKILPIIIYALLIMLVFVLGLLATGCTASTTTTITWTGAKKKTVQLKEVPPLILTQVAEFKDSSRIISRQSLRGEPEDIYVIAVKKNAPNAKALINDRNYDKIKTAHNKEWENLPPSPIPFEYQTVKP